MKITVNNQDYDSYEQYINSVKREFQKSIKVDESNREEFRSHMNKFSIIGNELKLLNQGSLFLYEEYIHSDKSVTYPKIGIYLNTLPFDQTIGIEWVDYKRTFDFNHDVLCDASSIISNRIVWDDDLFVYGIWDSLPDWKKLRTYYDKTFFFKKTKSEIRNIKINKILNDKK
jgi:hypothetical protein